MRTEYERLIFLRDALQSKETQNLILLIDKDVREDIEFFQDEVLASIIEQLESLETVKRV